MVRFRLRNDESTVLVKFNYAYIVILVAVKLNFIVLN